MISFIGAGKVGSALGLYFKQKGFNIGGYYSRTSKHAHKASKLTRSKVYTDIKELLENSSMVWITVSDDALQVVSETVARCKIPQHIKAFVHTSGVHSFKILDAIEDLGFSTYCAHPLMAFGTTSDSIHQLEHAYFSIDGIDNSENRDYLKDFFNKIGNNTIFIDSDKKELYHCAASVLSNYLVTLLHIAYEMFANSGMKEHDIKKATEPLLKSTLENIGKHNKMKDALTGAIKRGDSTTILKHLEILKKEMPDKIDFYKLMGRETMLMIEEFKLKKLLQ